MLWWRNRRVLHVISSGVIGGAEACYLEMLSGLSGLGYAVGAVCAPGAELYELSLRSCAKVYPVAIRDNADLPALARICLAISDFRPDLCHLHMNRATLVGAIASGIMGVKSLGTIQGEVRPVYARFPDYLTFCSRNVAAHVRSLSASVSRKPSFMLYNKVDCAGIAGRAEGGGRDFVLAEFGLPEDAFVVCQVARLHPNKGQGILIEAVASLACRYPSIRCLIVGGGDEKYERDLKELARRKNVSEKIVFTGTRLDVPKIVSGADLFVLPSLQEGIPVTIMEAMALSVPVVCFDVGGIRELCAGTGGESIIDFASPKDAAGLAGRIAAAVEDPAAFRRSAAAASAHVRRRFDSATYLRDIDAIYRDIFSRPFSG